jgi:hypothetical protein
VAVRTPEDDGDGVGRQRRNEERLRALIEANAASSTVID